MKLQFQAIDDFEVIASIVGFGDIRRVHLSAHHRGELGHRKGRDRSRRSIGGTHRVPSGDRARRSLTRWRINMARRPLTCPCGSGEQCEPLVDAVVRHFGIEL